MDDFLGIFITAGEKIVEWYQAFAGSTLFFIIKIILILYITILLVDVILLIYLGDPRKKLRAQFRGTDVPISKKKKQKEWKVVKDRLNTTNENQYKLAVLEADHLVEKALEDKGYHGDNFAEKISQVPQHFSSRLEAVSQSHQLRNEIIRNDSAEITKEQASEAVEAFEGFLKALDVL